MIVKKPQGLGDTIHNLTITTGIKKVVDKFSEVTNTDCGCSKRRKSLNDMFPYNNK
jgi:hypothetical protein